jgi:hypothetical protein
MTSEIVRRQAMAAQFPNPRISRVRIVSLFLGDVQILAISVLKISYIIYNLADLSISRLWPLCSAGIFLQGPICITFHFCSCSLLSLIFKFINHNKSQ